MDKDQGWEVNDIDKRFNASSFPEMTLKLVVLVIIPL